MPVAFRAVLAASAAIALTLPAGVAAQSRPKPVVAKPVVAKSGTAKPAAKAAPRNWSRVVTRGPDGAYSLGNPAAKVKVREYISYTCSHCAHFATTAEKPLKADYVATGRVQVEMRNAVRDVLDFTAAVAARCGPANQFWDRHMALLSSQGVWLDRAAKLPEETRAKWNGLGPGATMARIAADTGLLTALAGFGVTPARLQACGDTPAQVAVVEALSQASWETDKIDHTPTIALDGKIVEGIHDWPTLKTALDQRLAAR